jgi:hypothetical protein
MSHDYIPLLVKAVWPFTTAVFVFWFQKEIRKLIVSLSQIKFGNLAVLFGQTPTDDIDEREPRTPRSVKQVDAPSNVRWENSANLFWLGNDLEWTSQTVLRGAPKEKVLHGLRHCEHHSSELGFADSIPGGKLSALKAEVTSLSEATLSRQWRIDFSERIYVVVREFDSLVRGNQPGFRPGPE